VDNLDKNTMKTSRINNLLDKPPKTSVPSLETLPTPIMKTTTTVDQPFKTSVPQKFDENLRSPPSVKKSNKFCVMTPYISEHGGLDCADGLLLVSSKDGSSCCAPAFQLNGDEDKPSSPIDAILHKIDWVTSQLIEAEGKDTTDEVDYLVSLQQLYAKYRVESDLLCADHKTKNTCFGRCSWVPGRIWGGRCTGKEQKQYGLDDINIIKSLDKMDNRLSVLLLSRSRTKEEKLEMSYLLAFSDKLSQVRNDVTKTKNSVDAIDELMEDTIKARDRCRKDKTCDRSEEKAYEDRYFKLSQQRQQILETLSEKLMRYAPYIFNAILVAGAMVGVSHLIGQGTGLVTAFGGITSDMTKLLATVAPVMTKVMTLGTAAQGAAAGALVGSFIFPGIGTTIGGVVGGVVAGTTAHIWSDQRLKVRIRRLTTQGHDGIHLYSFRYSERAQKDLGLTSCKQTGIIAQHVQQVYPSCVHKSQNGLLVVDYILLHKLMNTP
jgi:hypothetical protein